MKVAECKNGHMVCAKCCSRLHNTCPSCTLPVSEFRCMCLESIMESNKISCPYARYGCTESSTYNLRNIHKETCAYAPCYCPVPGCRFKGLERLLSVHLKDEHPSFQQQISFSYNRFYSVSVDKQQKFYVLCGRDDRIFLLINRQDYEGNQLSVACMRSGSLKSDLRCQLKVSSGQGTMLRMAVHPENIRMWRNDYKPNCFLYVPCGLTSSSEEFEVKVLIKKIRTLQPTTAQADLADDD